MGADDVVTFQGQCTVCNNICFTGTFTFRIDTIVTSHLVGRCFFYGNFAGGGIGDFGCASCFCHNIFTDTISAIYVDCAGIGNFCIIGILCLNTNILFRLAACRHRGITGYIDNACRAQVNFSRCIAIADADSSCTLGFLADSNRAVIVQDGIVAINKDAHLSGCVANQCSRRAAAVLCRATDEYFTACIGRECAVVFHAHTLNGVVRCFVYCHVNHTTGLVHGRCVVYPDTVVGKVQVGVSESGNIDNAFIGECAAVEGIHRCRLDIVIVFIGLAVFASIEIVGSIITTGNHAVVFGRAAGTAHSQAVEHAR